MNFNVFSGFTAVASPGCRPRSSALTPPLGRPNFAREPAFHGEIIPAPGPICVAWKWKGEMTPQIALPGRTQGRTVEAPAWGLQGRVVNACDPFNRTGGAGGAIYPFLALICFILM